MIESLRKNSDDFHLYVFTFDDLSCNILRDMNLEKVTVISLSEFETTELLAVKESRTKAEYCWTCTPWTIKHIFENYNVQECIYIDADLVFYDNPVILLNEMKSDYSTLITEHRYSKLEKIYEEKRAGKFCVQFIAFNTSSESKNILNKWANQCIDWCYNRYENGKFGDQKYLDEWPEKYNNVHILENEGGGVAPWNIKKYHFEGESDGIFLTNRRTGKKTKLVFYHFQSLKLLNYHEVDLGWHSINKHLFSLIYTSYTKQLLEIENALSKRYPEYKTVFYKPESKSIKDFIKNSIKRLFRYNYYQI
jgi:hypothetical protein